MATDQIVALLIAERDRLSKAIEALQGTAKRRGRPPKNPLAALQPAPQRKTRTAAQRKAQSERMKKYWARRKEGKTKG